MKFESLDSAVEVHGQPTQTFVKCINKDIVKPILEQSGTSEIDPEEWYPIQLWLDIFNSLHDNQQGLTTFVDIGMRTIELTRYPEEVKNIPFVDFMVHGADQTHQHNHRGGDAGGYNVYLKSENHIVVDARVPYPDDFVYGCYYQLTKQFRPQDCEFLLEYDADHVRRDDGGKSTMIHITWQSE